MLKFIELKQRRQQHRSIIVSLQPGRERKTVRPCHFCMQKYMLMWIIWRRLTNVIKLNWQCYWFNCNYKSLGHPHTISSINQRQSNEALSIRYNDCSCYHDLSTIYELNETKMRIRLRALFEISDQFIGRTHFDDDLSCKSMIFTIYPQRHYMK